MRELASARAKVLLGGHVRQAARPCVQQSTRVSVSACIRWRRQHDLNKNEEAGKSDGQEDGSRFSGHEDKG